jgi:hypothetical protein
MPTVEQIFIFKPEKLIKFNTKFSFVDEHDRKLLGEGRIYGCGFAFCKREGKVIRAIQAVSSCREYLNDQLFSELTGKECSAWNMNCKQENIFNDGKSYLVFGILEYRNGGKYANYDRDYTALKSNWKNLEKLLNWFEKRLNLKEKTKIIPLTENRYLAIMPKFWVDALYKISLYTLIMRSGIFYTGGDPLEFLFTCKNDAENFMMIQRIKDKIEKLLSGNIPVQNVNDINSPHGMGIVNFNFSA